jgi:hypothetical protein
MTSSNARQGGSRLTIFTLVLTLALAVVAATEQGAAAEPLARNKTQLVTPRGVADLRLGATVASLHRHRLIRGLRPGCELDPGQRVARLRPPLQGFAIFADGKNRLTSIQIAGGAATSEGIGIGSTPAEARHAYPRALYKPPGSFDPFAEGFLWVNEIAGAKLTFIVDPDSDLICEIDIPSPNFCE